MNFKADHERLRRGPVQDPALRFSTAKPVAAEQDLARA